ncbi:MATE family efflux transporter [Romboutsia sp. 1001713B170207_170306_H8]|uniref:MATE family efflux transporter n=1 Tax=Romboutsia sp. 1001713B170207_170306_H8 TaxID=2787112 RepID=UPI0008225F6C|nr:MATE family efflux transporter [Romboutsia sp. 1001713B170207_170306_H8]SCH70119.1 Staphylococcal virulence regulator protein A [uncultured Clostridium sp.]
MTSNQMTEGNIAKQITLFAIPILISNLFQQLYNTVDVAIVGRYVGANALAAVGSCNLIVVFMIYFFIGISNGASVIISQSFGKNDKDKIHKSVHTIIALSLISGFLLMVLGLTFGGMFLRWINTPDNVLTFAITYIKIYFISMIPMMIFNMGSGILRAVGDSKTPLYYLAISGITNIILDIVFAVVFKLGVAGVAMATTIAQFVSSILILIKLIKTSEVYKLFINKIKIDFKILKEILLIGIPTGIQSVLVCFANIIVQSKVNIFGLNVMAGYTIYYKIEGFIYMPISAIALAVSNFVGQNVGASEFDRVKLGKNISMIICVSLTIIIGSIILFNASDIIRIFSKDLDVINEGSKFIYWIVPIYSIYAINEVLMGVMRGAGETFIPMIIGTICMCGLRILWLSVMISHYKDINIVYLSYPITWIVTNIFTIIYYSKGNWLSKNFRYE